MNKESKCRTVLDMKCSIFMADIGCRYYRESKLHPLKCAYRFEGECLCRDACHDAMETTIRIAGFALAEKT